MYYSMNRRGCISISPTDDDNDKPPDLSSVEFCFDCSILRSSQHQIHQLPVVERRKANDDLYPHWKMEPTSTRHYLVQEWKNVTSLLIVIHRIIWYNYVYQGDRDMDLNQKLNAWATQGCHNRILSVIIQPRCKWMR
jgi:hypothetical protein